MSKNVSNVLKWSAVTSGVAGMMVLTGIFSIWLVVQTLSILTGFNA